MRESSENRTTTYRRRLAALSAALALTVVLVMRRDGVENRADAAVPVACAQSVAAAGCYADTEPPGTVSAVRGTAVDRYADTEPPETVSAVRGTAVDRYADTEPPETVSEDETAESGEAQPTIAPERKERLKKLAAERYALGVILAGAISIGILIVLFLYWSKKSGRR